MKILVTSYDFPSPDQSSGELRFYSLLSLLAAEHEVIFFSAAQQSTPSRKFASSKLAQQSILIEKGSFESVLRRHLFDIVLFEFYFVAQSRIDAVRVWQPAARIIVDSVDVHFHRLRSRARLTGAPEDLQEAERVRNEELAVYRKAELVVTVSHEDRNILKEEGVNCQVEIVPNVHAMHALQAYTQPERLELIFVGSYKWAPNVDAMIYFCSNVMPVARRRIPALRLRIVGSSPTDEIKALAADDVEVVGYVEDTTPYLLTSHVSIAPLRYGGGIKGKIGEAMAHGLPVVSSSIGAEGFDFIAGRDILIADTPSEFADCLETLWKSPDTHDRIRRNGWERISERLSTGAVSKLLPLIIDEAYALSPQRAPGLQRAWLMLKYYMREYVFWRFK